MIKCYFAQMNTIVGDIEGNLQKCVDVLERARSAGADLVIYPEQTFLGYPAKDLLLFHSAIRRNREALEKLAGKTEGGPALIAGFVTEHGGSGIGLYNSMAFCRGGRIETVYHKRLLPTYDVFDEDRYFDEGREVSIVELAGVRIGLTICEDMWNENLYQSRRLYESDPVGETVRAGAQLIVNISASPFTIGKRKVRREMMVHYARKHGIGILQVNLVGGNDDLIFDGSSMAVSADGSVACMARSFEEDELLVEYSDCGEGCDASGRKEEELSDMEELRRALVLGIHDYVKKCGFRRVIIGVSGGIDSALVSALAVQALGRENIHGISMPSRYSSEHSKSDAVALCENLGVRYTSIPIEGMFTQALEDLDEHLEGPGKDIAIENIQSRLRGLTTMAISNASGDLVLTTGNKSEMSVGYCTLYGDMVGGLAAIADVPKLVVYRLCEHMNEYFDEEIIPRNIIEKPPSAELRADQKDSDTLPPYDVLDPIIRGYVEEHLDEQALIERGHDAATVSMVIRMVSRNEYKRRQAPPTLKVTTRAFGFGWRMPIARK